jgi:hypothetical protein
VFEEFIDVKGWKALGNKLDEGQVKVLDTKVEIEDEGEDEDKIEDKNEDEEGFNPGDTVDLDVKKRNQGELFD